MFTVASPPRLSTEQSPDATADGRSAHTHHMPSISRVPALRRLSAADAPLPGDLLPSAEPVVWTDVALWADNPAWRADPDGHLLAPVDAGTGPDGRGLLVPHCPQRLRAWLDGRASIDAAAAVTVAVSVLRGCAEADGLRATHGTWWVTSSGKPVLALNAAATWRDESDAVLARLADDAPPALAAALDSARTVLADPRLLRREGSVAEGALFAVAAPGPLEMAPSPQRARPAAVVSRPAVSPADDTPQRARSRREAARAEAPGAALLRDAVRRHLDAEWADRVADAWSRLSRRTAIPSVRRTGSRRRVIALAAIVGIAVLTLGLWLPGEPRSAADPRARPTPAAMSAMPSPAEPAGPRASAAPEEVQDVREIGEELVSRLAGCAASGCPAGVAVAAGQQFPIGAATTPSIDRRVSLLDEYGGAAALRVTSGGGDEHPDQIVVIIRDRDEWLVREVYDVADQP